MSHHRDHNGRGECTRIEELGLEANAIRMLGASVLDADDIGTHAIEYGVNNWPNIPLNGKIPAIPNPHPKGSRERRECHGECGLYGHGVNDATTDVTVLASWLGWSLHGLQHRWASTRVDVRARCGPAQRR